MNSIDIYTQTLLKGEKEFKYLSSIPSHEWTTVNNNDNNKIYRHEETIKIVQALAVNEANLDHFYASLSTLSIRSTWCPLFKEITVKQSNTHNVAHAKLLNEEFDLVEQTIKKKHHVEFISRSVDDNLLLCFYIENRLDKASITMYYQCDKLNATELLSTTFNNFLNMTPFPWISHCDKAIKIQKSMYNNKEFELDYIFKEEKSYKNNGLAVNILPNQQQQRFMTSSSLLFSSSPKLNATRVMSSYPDKRQFTPVIDDIDNSSKDELRIQVDTIPTLTVQLMDKTQWSDKFAQLCIRCYKKSNKTGYIIQILHPYKLMQYFKQEESMKLDEDEEEEESIHVQLMLDTKQDNTKFLVNENEWPIRSWNYDNETSSSSSSSSSGSENEQDIFVDGMENIIDHTVELLPPPIVTQQQIHHSNKIELTPSDDIETILPDNDPVALQKIYPQFSQYINSHFDSPPTITQAPSKENGQVTIKQFQIPHHPMGGFLTESIWKDCSIWDIKSVLESAGARKIWDNTFESTTFLHALTQTSSIWHTKIKGAWPVNPRDYVCFHGQYASSYRIDLLSTSCIGESFQYKPLPKETPGYIRATMDFMGWRLERLDDTTISVKHVLVTQFSTWVINYITSRFLVQSCAAVQSARDYLDTFGAPPSLETLNWALLVNLKHDHERKNWRCEYTRRTESENSNNTSTLSIIRLDKRRWASESKNKYSVVIDPPPSRVTAIEKVCDPYGVWVSIEHDEEFIIPLRGKILVLIKPDLISGGNGECQLNVNGVSTFIEKESIPNESTFSINFLKDETALKRHSTISEEEQARMAIEQLAKSPKEYAQAALSFLRQTDEQFGWTVISDNTKSSLRVSKKPGTKSIKPMNELPEDTSSILVVPDPYMVYKATKVIENFSVEEVTALVTDIHNTRKMVDDTLEYIDLIQDIDSGSRVISQTIKAMFPFKNRQVYATSCLAQETSTLPNSNQRTLYIESSIPDFPIINSKKTRGNVYMSGWILEAIDPYTTTTNHPIPSMRVTYVSALDLGNSVPSYISNLVANNWASKKIQSIESYLKSRGSPPFITQPTSALVFSNNTLSNNHHDGIEWLAIQTNYDDEKHHYKVNNRLKLEPKMTQEIPSASSSVATSPLRRPSTHTLLPDVNTRRGSLPVNVLPKKRITSIEVIKEKSPVRSRSITFLQATFDLRVFSRGYEMTAQLYDVTDNKKKNISHKLTASVSEPSLSNLVDGKKKRIKHTVFIKADGLSPPSTATYEFEFSLIPAREETVQNKATRLTVDGVLGEEDNKWNGIILINGSECEIGVDVVLKSLAEEVDNESIVMDDKPATPLHDPTENADTLSNSSSGSEYHDHIDEPSMALQYMGGGVVAAALGNVSAGVNNFGARMMLPFRSTSTSFLIPNHHEEPHPTREILKAISSEEEEEDNESIQHGRFSREERRKISSSTLHEIRLLRRSRDTMRKGIFLLMICLGTAVVLALLMLQPMLERYYADSSTIESLDRSIEHGIIRRLVQIPWFGGWDIQIIAVKRGDV